MAPEPTCVVCMSRPSSPIEAKTTPCKTSNSRRLCNKRSSREILPATSTYYLTSASKAKILHQAKEQLEKQNIDQQIPENINQKKTDLILSINSKMDDLRSMKYLIQEELNENENFGKQTHNLVASLCTAREHERYNLFVQDLDKISNLIHSLSGRLARVENAIQMLPANADKQEKEFLHIKKLNLTEQNKEANQLKENINRRQQTVCKILAGYLSKEQFADFRHFINMKTELIAEVRELDDKVRLGKEQMNALKESLPEEWQINLDKMLDE
ncbi:protein Shroom2-like [Clavelina lepadiformis]|uniref:protein Shroom2-like n=1 Tax=Clavelina lepadiformis TaxID=159417 RepID=UPI00404277D9